MADRITSSELVAIITYQDRWESITSNSNELLVHTDPAYANYREKTDKYALWAEILYRQAINDEEIFETLTLPKYFVLSVLISPSLEALIERYNPENYPALDEHKVLFLRQLFYILHRIKHILEHDRNQVIDQVLSLYNSEANDLFRDFCVGLKSIFCRQLLMPLPCHGFLNRTMIKQILTAHSGSLKDIRTFHNNRFLVSVDHSVLIITRISDGQKVYELEINDEELELTALEVVEDKHLILAVFREGIAIAWQWFYEKHIFLNEVNRVSDERAFLDIHYYKGNTAAIASTKGGFFLWDFYTNRKIFIACGINSLHSLMVLPNKDIIVCGGAHLGESSQKIFKILKAETWTELYSSPAHEWPVDEVHLISPGLVVSRSNDTVSLYDTKQGKLLLKIGYARTLHASCIVPGTPVMLLAEANTIHILDLLTGEQKKLVTTHHGIIVSILIEDDIIITASHDQTVRIWDRQMLLDKTGAGRHHSDDVTCIEAADAWNCFFSGSKDGTVILWDMNSLQPIKVISAHTHWVSGLQLIEGGKREFISYSWDGCVNLCNINTSEKTVLACFEGKHIIHLHYHPTMKKIIFSEYDQTIWMYDMNKKTLDKIPVCEKVIRFFYTRANDYWFITAHGNVFRFNYITGVEDVPAIAFKMTCADAFFASDELYVSDNEGGVYKWNHATYAPQKITQLKARITGLIKPQNIDDLFLTITGLPHYLSDNTLRIHSLSGKTLGQFTVESPLTACAYSMHHKVVCVGDNAGGIFFFGLNLF